MLGKCQIMKTLQLVLVLAYFSCCLLFSACDQTSNFEQNAAVTPVVQESMDKGNEAFKQEDYKTAIDYYLRLLKILEPQGNLKIYPEILVQLGTSYFKLQDYDKALDYYYLFLELPQVQSSPKEKAKGIGSIASVHQKVGNYEDSYQLQIDALKIREAENDSAGIGRSLYELGTLMFYQKNYELAREYYQSSLNLSKAMGNKKATLSCLNAMGTTYQGLDSTNLVLPYLEEALALARELGKKSAEAYALHNIGAHYLEKKSFFQTAEAYFLESYQIKLDLDDKWGLIGSHIYLGDLYLKQSLLEKARLEYEKGLALAEEIDSDVRKVALLNRLAEVYELKKDYPQALLLKNKYISLNESILNEKMLEEMGNKKAQYLLQKKEKDIAIFKEKARTKKLRSNFLLILSFFSICLVGLSYNSHTRLQFTKKLKEKNTEIQQQNQDLARKNDDLKKFAFIVSHDLKAPLRTIGSFTGLMRRRYFHLFDKNGQEYMDFITGGVKRMDQLLNDLLTYSQIENNEQESDWTETKDVVHNALSNLYFQIRNQKVAIKINEIALPRVRGNSAHLTQLFQNIIANGIKFRNGRDPQILIDCLQNEEKYTFAIKDNGIGIEEQYQEKIFRMFSRLHKVEEYEGTGIGLATCKKIVEKHGGKIWVESAPGQGSTFFFSLPKN